VHDRQYEFRIDENTLAGALDAFAQQAHVLVLYPYGLARVTGVKPLAGRYTVREAYEVLLRGTGFSGGLTESGVLTISHQTRGEAMSPQKKGFASFLALFAGLGAPVVHAQDRAQDANSAEEIVVTATRRSESIQRIPMTISAFSSEALTKSGATDTRALQAAVPGLTFTSGNVGQTLVYMRGIGTSVLGLGAGTSVATYIDGVYMPNQQQALQKFSSIERIEVLKGPQATLYGRNATAGAINIISRAPSDTFHMDADASYGNYDAVTLRTTVTGPLSSKVNGLISALYDTHNGYFENVQLGNRPGAEKYVGAALCCSSQPTISRSRSARTTRRAMRATTSRM
jgi:outer membrane receptor protein involved in Fe transport